MSFLNRSKCLETVFITDRKSNWSRLQFMMFNESNCSNCSCLCWLHDDRRKQNQIQSSVLKFNRSCRLQQSQFDKSTFYLQGKETNRGTNKPSPVVFLQATFKLNSISLPLSAYWWGLMYASVCTVAGGSSGDEILFPCQIKASAAISVAAELGGCSHNAHSCQQGTYIRRKKTDKEEDMRTGRQGPASGS